MLVTIFIRAASLSDIVNAVIWFLVGVVAASHYAVLSRFS